MGFFGDLLDDVLEEVIEAARKAGCKTEKEIQEFFDQLEG